LTPVVALGSGLLSTAGACGSTTLIVRCVICDTSSSTVGLGCGFSQPARPPSPNHLLPLDQRGQRVESHVRSQNSSVSIHITARQVLDYSTRGAYLLRRSLSDFNILATCLRATLRGLLGGAGRLASRLVGGSSTRGMLGSPGRLNLDCS
jgi:hypothetical protein